MITDDQVARLVRDAGHAAPGSLRVDLDAIERQVAHDRTVARTTGLLSTVAVLLAVGLVWFDPRATLPDDAATGGGAKALASLLPALVLLVTLLVAVVATAVASRRAARTLVGSRLRAGVAASWGVLGVVALAPTAYLTSTVVVYPDVLGALTGHLAFDAVVVTVSVGLAWLALAARRRALGTGRGAFVLALWLIAAWGVGSWFAMAAVSYLGRDATTAPIDHRVAYTLAAAVGISLVCAAVLRRRAGSDHPFLRGLAQTVAFAAVVPALAIGAAVALGTSTWQTDRAAGIPFALGSLAVAFVSARLSLPRGASQAWLAAAAGVATVALSTSASIDLWSSLLHSTGPREAAGAAVVSVLRTLGLAVSAGLSLAWLDRHGAWVRNDSRDPDGESTAS